MKDISTKIIAVGITSFFVTIIVSMCFFFLNSEYFLSSLVSIVAIPCSLISVGMFFAPETRFLTINIVIVPALILTAKFVSLHTALILWLIIEIFVFVTRISAISELKKTAEQSHWIYHNYREIYVFHGLVSATAVGFLYYVAYINGSFEYAIKLISDIGGEGLVWQLVRFSFWPLFALLLVSSFVFLGMVLREILEALSLNHQVDDLFNKR